MADSDEDGDENAEAMASTQVDIKEYDNSYAFDVDMPGVKLGDIRVRAKSNNVLFMSTKRRRVMEEGAKYIKMEQPERNFTRKFALPENADTDKITAVTRDGVLTVTVEKDAPPPQPPIEVKEEALSSCEEDGCKVDRISMLPDELLVCIVSLLSFKEVCCASILCRRWRYLHTLTPNLDFDGMESLRKMALKPGDKGLRLEKEREYIELVDRAVRSHQSSRLSQFRVVFTLTKSHTQHLDEWVAFALSRKVESLDLHFSTVGGGLPERLRYTFPYKYLNTNSHLRRLSTRFVNVRGEAVEMLLRNCPLLEQVSITMSKDLVSLEIANPFPAFTRLEILFCHHLTSVVIRDSSSITSFRYMGATGVRFVFENVPLLGELWVGGGCTESSEDMDEVSEDVVGMFSPLLPHLHIFKIFFSHNGPDPDFCSMFREAVAMTSLKKLVLQIGSYHRDKDSLRPLIHIIKASPRLQRLVIMAPEPHRKHHVNNPLPLPLLVDTPRINREMPRLYPHLKEVEFVGYRGVSSQFRILKHFMKNAIALETLIVDPWSFDECRGISWDRIRRPKIDSDAFARANALKQCASFGININIL